MGSPYVGIFCIVTDNFALVPISAGKKIEKYFEKFFNVKAISTTIANSQLLGVFGAAVGDRIIVPEVADNIEISTLEKEGLKVKELSKSSALGNLIAINKNHCIASTIFDKKQLNEIEKFFKVDVTQMPVVNTEVPGSCIRVTNKGFIVHPSITEKDYKLLKKLFKVHGMPTTANYGDNFVSNSVLANSNAALVGLETSGFELTRIDEAFMGE